jgi:DNA polymerase-1
MPRPQIFLIDGSSQMYRAYHAFRGKGLSNQEGQSTHAVYVFVTMLRKLIADHAPTLIAASFDLAGPTFRKELADDYKANRAAMPDDLAEQTAWVREACEALGVPILTAPGYEADDVLGTLARRATGAGFDVALVSIDKDFFQLVGDNVRVYDPREDGQWFDAAGVKEKFGVEPRQVVDVLALVGDTSDNVSGVPGIGKKGAIDLISQFGSLDALLASVGTLKPKQREALTTHREDALRSQSLVTIRTDVPLEIDFESLRYRGASRDKCYTLFQRLAFRSLMNEYAPSADTTATAYTLVTTRQQLDAVIAGCRAAGEFAIDVVTNAPGGVQAELVGLAFSHANRQGAYVPLGHGGSGPADDLLSQSTTPEQLELGVAIDALRPLIEDQTVRTLAHDAKPVLIALAPYGVDVKVAFDSMLASYLLDPTRSQHGVADTALEHLGYKAVDDADVLGSGARAVRASDVAPEALLRYAAERADLARQLARGLAPALEAEGLAAVNEQFELPLVAVLADIERAGVRVDTASLALQSGRLEGQLAELSARIYALAGMEFNVNSPKQLGEVLFERLKLPVLRKTGQTRTASTAVEVLEELAESHELPRLILDWRSLQKLKGTYVDALPLLVNPRTGRVHTSFNQAVAATGRLSSSDPNLQNIPIRTEIGREIRRAFVAEPDHVLISADYSQIELRVLAHMAGDETLIEAFKSGEDIHDRTALKVFGPSPGLDPHELRRRAKIVNYALLYGKTAFTLARDIGVSKEAAQEFIDAYFAGFPRVRKFIDDTLEGARQTGVVRTMFGRRRLVPDLNSRNGQVRAGAERATVNMPIQGTAADILKRAMIDVHGDLKARGGSARMILTVHDELLFEAPRADAEAVAELVRSRMEGAVTLKVPLTVDVGIGENWRDAKA